MIEAPKPTAWNSDHGYISNPRTNVAAQDVCFALTKGKKKPTNILFFEAQPEVAKSDHLQIHGFFSMKE